MDHHGDQVTIEALIPMRGLIGFETDLVNTTRGLGVMSHLFHEYGAGPRRDRRAQERLAGQHGQRGGHRLRAEHDPGTRPADGRARRRDLRGA